MDKIKQILQQEIDRLNRTEQRDNRPRFSFTFCVNIRGCG